jgi:Glycosyl hydrolase family 1
MKWSLPNVAILVVMLGILAGVAVGVTLLIINSTDAVRFPDDFRFGAASASYQIEGGWNEDGKSPNIWDTVTHNNPNFTADSKNADVAADSYHMVDKDVEALDNIGVSVNIVKSCETSENNFR